MKHKKKWKKKTLVSIGTEVKPYGVVAGVLYIGERYYLLTQGNGCINLMPASVIEEL